MPIPVIFEAFFRVKPCHPDVQTPSVRAEISPLIPKALVSDCPSVEFHHVDAVFVLIDLLTLHSLIFCFIVITGIVRIRPDGTFCSGDRPLRPTPPDIHRVCWYRIWIP